MDIQGSPCMVLGTAGIKHYQKSQIQWLAQEIPMLKKLQNPKTQAGWSKRRVLSRTEHGGSQKEHKEHPGFRAHLAQSSVFNSGHQWKHRKSETRTSKYDTFYSNICPWTSCGLFIQQPPMDISTKLLSHLPLSPCKFLAPATSFGKESCRSVAWRSYDHGEELTLGIASAVSPGTCLQSTIYQGRGGLIFHSHVEIPKSGML